MTSIFLSTSKLTCSLCDFPFQVSNLVYYIRISIQYIRGNQGHRVSRLLATNTRISEQSIHFNLKIQLIPRSPIATVAILAPCYMYRDRNGRTGTCDIVINVEEVSHSASLPWEIITVLIECNTDSVFTLLNGYTVRICIFVSLVRSDSGNGNGLLGKNQIIPEE